VVGYDCAGFKFVDFTQIGSNNGLS